MICFKIITFEYFLAKTQILILIFSPFKIMIKLLLLLFRKYNSIFLIIDLFFIYNIKNILRTAN